MSRRRLVALLALALLLVVLGVTLTLNPGSGGHPGTGRLSAAEHARRSCAAIDAAVDGIRRDRSAEAVFSELDRADREARAAVMADPVYAQLASAVILARRRIRDDSTDGLSVALELIQDRCQGPQPTVGEGPSIAPSR